MQFFIIHDDPKINSRLLPDYCIKSVNCREGYQMLSDIGHLFGVRWEGQNKNYNVYHAETRQYWKNIRAFDFFVAHYEACLSEYEYRYWHQTKFHENYFNFQKKALSELRSKITNYSKKYNQVVQYLLKNKTNKLTAKEIVRLEGIV